MCTIPCSFIKSDGDAAALPEYLNASKRKLFLSESSMANLNLGGNRDERKNNIERGSSGSAAASSLDASFFSWAVDARSSFKKLAYQLSFYARTTHLVPTDIEIQPVLAAVLDLKCAKHTLRAMNRVGSRRHSGRSMINHVQLDRVISDARRR